MLRSSLKCARPGGIALWLALFLCVSRAEATELLMFHEEGCPWCEAWEEQIGTVYPKTEEAVRAPLRRIDISEDLPEDLKDLRPVNFTPTFIVFDRGKEVGRIPGYPGEDFFWFLLGEILDKADKGS